MKTPTMPSLPDCYEADREEEARDLAYTARMMRRPNCYCCDKTILTDRCMKLNELGLNGEYICEDCIEENSLYSYELDEDDD